MAMATARFRILFVDDEQNLLDGLRRALRVHRADWDMAFAAGPTPALEALARGPFDAVVTDMRMPEMSGAELLERVRERWPGTLRFILSGQSELTSIMKAVGPAHQYLSKPCDPAELASRIAAARELRAMAHAPEVLALVGRIERLPVRPALYSELVRAVDEQRPMGEIGALIEHDPALAARVLQLVNSSFFGPARRIVSLAEAAAQLGTETLQALVIGAKLVCEFPLAEAGVLDRVWRDASRAAACARAIGSVEKVPAEVRAAALTAALLHDLGELALWSARPDLARQAAEESPNSSGRWKREVALAGACHGVLGAYLAGIMGLPDAIVASIAYHHRPADSPDRELGVVAIVHAATTLARCEAEDPTPEDALAAGLDADYLREVGALDRLPAWLEACAACLGSASGG